MKICRAHNNANKLQKDETTEAVELQKLLINFMKCKSTSNLLLHSSLFHVCFLPSLSERCFVAATTRSMRTKTRVKHVS